MHFQLICYAKLNNFTAILKTLEYINKKSDDVAQPLSMRLYIDAVSVFHISFCFNFYFFFILGGGNRQLEELLAGGEVWWFSTRPLW